MHTGLCPTDSLFASTYTLVCAVGARFSDDPRVFLCDSYHPPGSTLFNRVQIQKKTLPSLYELQFYCVRTFFNSPPLTLMDYTAFCSFFTKTFCTATVLDLGSRRDTFGSGRWGASTRGSSAVSDSRG